MKAILKIENPDEIEVKMLLTMTLGDWKKLRQQLTDGPGSQSYPSYKLRDVIRDLVTQAETKFTHTEGESADV